MNNPFNTKYPIICLPMNRVSDIDLAIACSKAGILPSLVYENYEDDFDKLTKDLSKFDFEFGHCNIMFLCDADKLTSRLLTFFKILKSYRVPFLELGKLLNLPVAIKIIKEYNFKIVTKDNNYPVYTENWADSLYAVNIKRPSGAGLYLHNQLFPNTADAIADCKRKYPHLHIVVSGGISSGDEIKELQALGANTIGMGTVFAFSAESKISNISKEKIINGNCQITNNIKGRSQNGIIFEIDDEIDDKNNTNSLIKGVNATGGHLFVGQGVKNIKSIKTVEEIVNDLINV